MKRILLAFCFITSSLLSLNSKSQAIISMDSSFVVNLPPVVNQDDTITYTAVLRNIGNAAITDSIFVYSGFRNSQNIVTGIERQYVIPNGALFLAPNDTINANLSLIFSANRFPLGIDVVVIWPQANGALTLDTNLYVPMVLPPLKVAELLRDNGIKVFPNPFSDNITVNSVNPVDEINIYDSSGKRIISYSNEKTVDLSKITEATYILELRYKNGTKKQVKLIKQKSTYGQ